MIIRHTVRLSANSAVMQLDNSVVDTDSSNTFVIVDAPCKLGKLNITDVRVAVVNAAGVARTEVATLIRGAWCATFPASHFAAAGKVKNGVLISALGTDEDGNEVTDWMLGIGDLEVQARDASAANLGTAVLMHIRSQLPEIPVPGDVIYSAGAWQIYDGSTWIPLGGGGAVSSVNGRTGNVVLNAGDVGAIPEGTTVPLAERAESAAHADEAGMTNWPNILQKPAWLDRDNKPTYTAGEVGAAPGKIILTLASVATPTQHYEIRRDGVVQTFDQVRGYVASGEVFINHANAFYKPTYSSNAEIMFDCVGVIGGKVETRRIQMLASGAVALSDLKVLVEDSMLPYPIAATTGAIADRTVNTGTATTYTLPDALGSGKARDFVLVLDLTSGSASTITINPATGETIQLLTDTDDTFSAEAGKVNILYFSEITAHKFMVVRKAVA